jgi:hypothetical protein
MARNLLIGAAALSAVLLSAPAFATTTVNVGEVFNVSNAGGNIGPGLFDQEFTLTVAGNGELDGSITVSSRHQPIGATFDLYAGSVSAANLLVSSAYSAFAPTAGAAGFAYLSAVTGVKYIAVFEGDVSHQVSSGASFSLTPPVATGVPELSTWAMLGLGFVSLGFVGSRKRNTARIAA